MDGLGQLRMPRATGGICRACLRLVRPAQEPEEPLQAFVDWCGCRDPELVDAQLTRALMAQDGILDALRMGLMGRSPAAAGPGPTHVELEADEEGRLRIVRRPRPGRRRGRAS